jgi:hypothetical protein
MKMQCWMDYSDSHGFILFNPIWLPEGEYPDDAGNYERVPQFDFERTKVRQLNFRGTAYADRKTFIEEYEAEGRKEDK